MQTETADRRRSDLAGRVARATWPARMTWQEFLGDLGDLPCKVLGHHWREVSPTHLGARDRQRGRMRFRCTRCFLMGGFSN